MELDDGSLKVMSSLDDFGTDFVGKLQVIWASTNEPMRGNGIPFDVLENLGIVVLRDWSHEDEARSFSLCASGKEM